MDLQLGKYVNKQLERRVNRLNNEGESFASISRFTTVMSGANKFINNIKTQINNRRNGINSLETQRKMLNSTVVLPESHLKSGTLQDSNPLQNKILSSTTQIQNLNFQKIYKDTKKQMELQIMRENYKNLPSARILDKLDFDTENYDKNLQVYRKKYRYQEYQEKIKQYQEQVEKVDQHLKSGNKTKQQQKYVGQNKRIQEQNFEQFSEVLSQELSSYFEEENNGGNINNLRVNEKSKNHNSGDTVNYQTSSTPRLPLIKY
eukprot:403358333